MKGLTIAAAALLACALVASVSGCKGDQDVGGDVKTGTDKLPDAPGIGNPPGMVGKGGPSGQPGSMPGNK